MTASVAGAAVNLWCASDTNSYIPVKIEKENSILQSTTSIVVIASSSSSSSIAVVAVADVDVVIENLIVSSSLSLWIEIYEKRINGIEIDVHALLSSSDEYEICLQLFGYEKVKK